MKPNHKEIYFNTIIKPSVASFVMNERKVVLDPAYLIVAEQKRVWRREMSVKKLTYAETILADEDKDYKEAVIEECEKRYGCSPIDCEGKTVGRRTTLIKKHYLHREGVKKKEEENAVWV